MFQRPQIARAWAGGFYDEVPVVHVSSKACDNYCDARLKIALCKSKSFVGPHGAEWFADVGSVCCLDLDFKVGSRMHAVET
ncbi:hypothetical protein [Xanthomonas medicagonis]|uniref:hypothetical protein n=1 Tax=Xanthomonas medicagonis TaxID=3160841 RepID=UPI003510E9C1